MTKQVVNLGASANDGTGDPIRIAFDRVNDNFNEVYNALGNSQNPIDLFDNAGALDLNGKPHKVSFYYATKALVDAVSPSTYHGAMAHAHDTGSMYYAHGSWRGLLSDNSAGDITNYVDPLNLISYKSNVTNEDNSANTANLILKTVGDGTYTWGLPSADAITLNTPTDVTISNPALNQVLTYNGSAWVNLAAQGGGGGGDYNNAAVDTHLNTGSASNNQVLGWTGSDYDWVTAASGSTTLLALTDVGSDGTNGQVLTTDGSGNFSFTTIGGGGGGDYADSDVSAHLNTSAASADQILSWTGSDFAWVADQTGGASTLSALTEVALADLDVHDMAYPASAVHVMTPNGSSAYRSDYHGTTDNPTLYVNAGETIAFDLTDVSASHPFQIQTTGDVAYNTGLIHVAPDGTKTSGSAANGKTSGVLYWKVPGSISGDYEYICTVHAGMKGTITIKDPSASAGGAARVTETETTASIGAGTTGNVSFATLGKSFAIQKVTAEKESWIRIYSDTASRTADASRTQGTDPADGSGVIAEFIATSANTVFKVTPAIYGWLDDGEATVPVAIQNNTAGTTTTSVTIQALKIES
jgi:plastocyanin